MRVTPGAKVEAVQINGDTLAIKTRAKPQDGAANDAVLAMLAKAIGTAPTRLKLLRGATSREKLVQLD